MVAAAVVNEALAQLCERLAPLDAGAVADYIPELASADPDSLGVALTSMDGHSYAAGDAGLAFSMQSISKPFVFALALAELGVDEVSRWVGAEPSGEAFNAISLQPVTGRPANPMVNVGAIATTALVPADSEQDRFARILTFLGRCAGRPLDVDEAVFTAELTTGDRARAMAYLMRAAGHPGDLIGAVATYCRQCAVRVTVTDLAVMAATLANGGVNPVTGDAVVPEAVAVQVLAVMATCGMYDGSGDWLLRVGLPAKSGVSGGLVAVSPGRFGIATFSPPLDAHGNSVRGLAALRETSARFGLHLMKPPASSGPTVTTAVVLPGTGGPAALVAVQGTLDFTAAERVLFALTEVAPAGGGRMVLDLAAVIGVEGLAAALLRSGLERLSAAGHRITLTGGAAVDGLAAGAPELGDGAPDLADGVAGGPAWGRHPGREEALAWARAGDGPA